MNKFRSVSKQDIQKMVKAVDTDGNGKISITGLRSKFLFFFINYFYKIEFIKMMETA